MRMSKATAAKASWTIGRMKRIFCGFLLVAWLIGTPVSAQKPIAQKTMSNSLGMKFVLIPPGSFLMGSPKEEKERKPDETRHKVKLEKGFYMGTCSVT